MTETPQPAFREQKEGQRIADHTPAEALEFDTLEALDTIMSPFRLRLMHCFRTPSTARQAADALGVKATRVYRHLHRLVDHGFLVVVDERQKAKTTEMVYGVAAKNVRPSRRFLATYGAAGNAELLRLTFRMVESEVVAAAESDPSLDIEGDHASFGYTRLRLTRSELADLAAALESLFSRFDGREGPIEVSFLGSVIPLMPPPDGGQHPPV